MKACKLADSAFKSCAPRTVAAPERRRNIAGIVSILSACYVGKLKADFCAPGSTV